MEAAELEQINMSFRSAMGETAGQFRQAASKSNEEIGKVVKDISRMFKAQREELNEIGNAIQESVHQSETESAKIERLAGIFEESVQIQNDMLTEMKKSSAGMKNLGDYIVQLNSNIMSTGANGILGSLMSLNTNVTGKLGELLLKGAGAAIVGGAAGYGAAGGFSGATTDSSVGKGKAEFQAISSRLTKDLQRDFPGLSKEDAAAIIGNLGEESAGFTQMQEAGGKGPGRGWAQWTSPDRKAKFLANVQKHGGDLANYDANYETLREELKGQYSGALREMMATRGLENKTRVFMQKFENPGVPAFDVRLRYSQRAMNVLGDSSSQESQTPSTSNSGSLVEKVKSKVSEIAKSEGRGTTTPNADATSTPENPSSSLVPRTEEFKHGHGPVSGAVHAEKTEGSAALPSGDIVALGHALEKMGMRISEHPDFGGVNPVHKGKAHYEGRAIDINIGKGKIEANDPVLGAKFDALAAQLTKLGYKVYWRDSGPYGAKGHDNHLHAELPKVGATPVPDTYQVPGTPEQRATQGATPSAGTTPTTPVTSTVMTPPAPAMETTTPAPAAIPQAQPIPQETVTPTSPMMGMMNPMSMLGGMLPGGMGGIAGMLIPIITSALQSEMVSMVSSPSLNTQLVSQAAVNKQAHQELAQDPITEVLNNLLGQQQNTPDVAPTPKLSGTYDGYNGPSDIGWPDWAEMIGGNHWKEMKNYKKNMWG